MADITVVLAYVLAGTLLLSAIALAFFARGNYVTWALVVLLMVRAGENLLEGLNGALWISERRFDPALNYTERALEAGMMAAMVAVALLFAGRYHDRRWLRWAAPASLIVLGVFLYDAMPGGGRHVTADEVVHYWGTLPARVLSPLGVLTGLFVMWAGRASGRETVRRAGDLVGVGMSLAWCTALGSLPVFSVACILGANGCGEATPVAVARWLTRAVIWPVTAVLVFWVLARWQRGRLAAGLAAVVATAAVLAAASSWGEAPVLERLFGVLVTLLVFAQPILLGYGILRYQVLGLDLKLRRTIKGSTLIAIFVAVFVGATQIAGAWIEDIYGSSVVGAGATLVLLAAIVPVRRFADGVSRRAAPDAKPVAAMQEKERTQVYREQLEFAWADGSIDKRERTRLETLRQRLGIDAETALGLEARLAAA